MQDPQCGSESSGVRSIAPEDEEQHENWYSTNGRRPGKHEHLGDALLSRRSYSWGLDKTPKEHRGSSARGSDSGLVFERRPFDAEEARTRAMGAL